MLPFGFQIHLSYKISDLLIISTGMSELWGTFVLITSLCLAQRLVRALSSSISLCLIDKNNQGRTLWEFHKCQTVHNEDQRCARTQWCIVSNWLSVIGGKCTLVRKICAQQQKQLYIMQQNSFTKTELILYGWEYTFPLRSSWADWYPFSLPLLVEMDCFPALSVPILLTLPFKCF